MILIPNIREGGFGSFQFIQDIIHGRNRNLKITGDKGIVFIESLTTDRTDIASGFIMDGTLSRSENGMIDLFQLIPLYLHSRGGTNRTKMFSDIQFKINDDGTILMVDMDVLNISTIEPKGSKKII